MNIVIIEDEEFTADDLASTILDIAPEAKIAAILNSVKSAVTYLENNTPPDLIFSDIQLGDGLSFEIFKKVKITIPVIFCTAYDEYAMNAFKANGIDYILKPYSEQDIDNSLNKYKNISQSFKHEEKEFKNLIDSLINRSVPKTNSVLVHFKDKILPIRLADVAIFFIDNEIVYLINFDKNKYSISKTLDEVSQLCGDQFFRINRQYLINRKAIIDASQYFGRKLSLNLKVQVDEKITVSKGKVPQFLAWLEQTE